MKMTGMNSAPGTGDMDVTYYLKNGQMAMEMTLPAGSQMAGQKLRMLYSDGARQMTMLIPMSADMMGRMGGMGNGTKGIKMMLDVSTIMADSMGTATVNKLGTSETIAGYSCDDFAVKTDNQTTTVCVTQELGRFVYPAMNMGRGRTNAPPAWTAIFGKQGFPLKLKMPDKQGTMEVTGVEKGSVPDSVFTVPSDYMDMSGMMGGRGGGGN